MTKENKNNGSTVSNSGVSFWKTEKGLFIIRAWCIVGASSIAYAITRIVIADPSNWMQWVWLVPAGIIGLGLLMKNNN